MGYSQPLQLIPGLPDDISIQILARFPCDVHSIFSRVSKSWKRAISNGVVKEARESLGLMKPCIYIITENSKYGLLHLQMYNIVDKRWCRLHPLPLELSQKEDIDYQETINSFSLVHMNGFIYLIGGFDRTSDGMDRCLNDVFCYEIGENRWRRVASMISPRFLFASGVIDSKIYVAGGLYFDRQSLVRDRTLNAEMYFPQTDSWQPLPSTHLHRSRGPDFGLLLDKKFTVVSEDSSSLAEAFDERQGEWTAVRVPPLPDRVMKVTVASDGTIFSIQNLWPSYKYKISAREMNGRVHLLAHWSKEKPGPVSHPRDLVISGKRLFLVGNEFPRAFRKRHGHCGPNAVQIASFDMGFLREPDKERYWVKETSEVLSGSWVMGCTIVEY